MKGSDILKELRVQQLFLLLHPFLEVFQTHLTGRRTCNWDYLSYAVKECVWIPQEELEDMAWDKDM